MPDTEVIVLAHPSPVFVDATGRRRRMLRKVAYGFGALCMIYGGLVSVSLAGGPVSSSAVLPLPDRADDDEERAVVARPRPTPTPVATRPAAQPVLEAFPTRVVPATRIGKVRVVTPRSAAPRPSPKPSAKPTKTSPKPIESVTKPPPPSSPAPTTESPTPPAPQPTTEGGQGGQSGQGGQGGQSGQGGQGGGGPVDEPSDAPVAEAPVEPRPPVTTRPPAVTTPAPPTARQPAVESAESGQPAEDTEPPAEPEPGDGDGDAP